MENIEKHKVTVTTTKVTVLPEHRKEFFQTITPLIPQIRGEKGCLSYRLYEEASDENSLIFLGEWVTLADLDEHRNGINFAVFVGSLITLSIKSKIDCQIFMQIGSIGKLRGL